MENNNRNDRNRWNDRRDYDDAWNNRNRDRNWNDRDYQQRNWNESGSHDYDNYGLGDTSQGSANYGNRDSDRGARYYGTGSYGGYYGSSSDWDRSDKDNYYGGNSSEYAGRAGRGRYGTGDYGYGEDFTGRGDYSRRYGYGRGRSYDDGSTPEHNSGYGRGGYSGYGSYGAGYQSGENYGSYSSEYGRNPDRYTGSRNWDRNKHYHENRGDRDWWDRTTDEVASWFGDEDAERRRERDRRESHAGKGPKNYTRSDAKIQDDVNERLYHDHFVDASDITVSVDDGDVTLSGTVSSRSAKRRAEDCAEAVTGVKDVSNNLKINRTATTTYGSSGSSGYATGSTGAAATGVTGVGEQANPGNVGASADSTGTTSGTVGSTSASKTSKSSEKDQSNDYNRKKTNK